MSIRPEAPGVDPLFFAHRNTSVTLRSQGFRPRHTSPGTPQQNGSRHHMPQHTSGSDRAAVPPAARGTVRPPAPSSLDELWRSYKDTGDERLREQLILHYSPLVKYVAGRVSVGLPSNVEQADFV